MDRDLIPRTLVISIPVKESLLPAFRQLVRHLSV